MYIKFDKYRQKFNDQTSKTDSAVSNPKHKTYDILSKQYTGILFGLLLLLLPLQRCGPTIDLWLIMRCNAPKHKNTHKMLQGTQKFIKLQTHSKKFPFVGLMTIDSGWYWAFTNGYGKRNGGMVCGVVRVSRRHIGHTSGTFKHVMFCPATQCWKHKIGPSSILHYMQN